MVQIYATTRVRYGHKEYLAGEPFEASDKDAKLLTQIRKATFAPAGNPTDLPAPAAPEPVVEAAAIEAEEPAAEAEPEAPARPQTYARRDMTAGPTGGDKPSRSSHPAHRSKRRT